MMIYNIRKIKADTIEHDIGGLKSIEVGVDQIEDLQAHLQDWVDQRKKVFKITKVNNNLGMVLTLK